MSRTPLKLKSASCQIAYWKGGNLRIANYLTGRTFSTQPATLNVIRFFFTPRTVNEALLEFRTYSQESVAESILKLIDAQLLLEHGSVESEQDERVRSSWETWLPEGGFHFMTKDTAYAPWDWPIEKKLKLIPATLAPPQFKMVRGAERIRLKSHKVATDVFFETLHARRTHREFASGKVSRRTSRSYCRLLGGSRDFSTRMCWVGYRTRPALPAVPGTRERYI